jgi:hypothetical protein
MLELLKEADPTIEDTVRGGTECIVVPVEGKDEIVAAYQYGDSMSGADARRTFYIHRVFSTLFPHNFPKFHAAIGQQPGDAGPAVAGTIRRRVEGQRKHSGSMPYPRASGDGSLREAPMRLLDAVTRGKKPVYPFKDVQAAAKEMRMAEFRPDTSTPTNFALGSDGGEYYLDNIAAFTSVYRVKNEILEYMRNHEYSEDDMKVVTSSLERLEALAEERNPAS